MRTLSLHVCFGAVIALLGAGCGAIDPYVYKRDEFVRSSKDFNKEPLDRTDVIVCYNGLATTDHRVAAIAGAECGRYGKQAAFSEETFGQCPLFTPVEAHFACTHLASVPGDTTRPSGE